MTFRLRVVLPGRAPYDVDHRQLVPIFALASLPVGATVPVMVDPRSPGTLTIDLGGEAAGTRQVTAISAAPSQVLPNTLSTRQGSAPNTFSSDPAGAVTAWPAMSQSGVTPVPSGAAQHQAGMALDQAHMIVGLLARSGIRLDPGALAQGAMTIAPATTIDAGQPSQGTSATLLASGRPGAAVIRDARDTGIVVHGDPVVELTLDVSPPGEAAHEVRTATLVPAAARARLLPGVTVPVRIDLAQPDRLAIDWQA